MKFNVSSSSTSFIIALLILFLTASPAKAQSAESRLDSVKISLLTCSPGDEPYSIFGHTAIRIHDLRSGQDVIVNYGIFSFKKKFFILRFVFGLTDYMVAAQPFEDFCAQYTYEDRSVIQQDLNLTNEDKTNILNAISTNCLPENRTYRYNFFYDNCTTRARDIITDNINGNVSYATTGNSEDTYRSLVHACCKNYRWNQFGDDLLLGIGADKALTNAERQFLPDLLRKDFETATVNAPDGAHRKLVYNSFTVLTPPSMVRSDPTAVTPRSVMVMLFVITVIITLAGWVTKKSMWVYDAILLIVSGTAGMILFAMIFSQHPTVNVNLQILCLNPLNLLFCHSVIKARKNECTNRYTYIMTLCLLLFLIGAFIQDYAEGMIFVALSLLLTNVSDILRQLKKKSE